VRPKSNSFSLCFPFNRADKNTGACTNEQQCSRARPYNPNQSAPGRPKSTESCLGGDGAEGASGAVHLADVNKIPAMATVEDLADRVERLLLRHEELRRTTALLEEQLAGATHERDSLRSRLNAARSRIDALLERLPAEAPIAVDGQGTAT
jgi:cell division protein ZapB